LSIVEGCSGNRYAREDANDDFESVGAEGDDRNNEQEISSLFVHRTTPAQHVTAGGKKSMSLTSTCQRLLLDRCGMWRRSLIS
jgi:hypothetical protein